MHSDDETHQLLLDIWSFLNECVEATGDTIWYSSGDTAHEAFIDIAAQYRPELAAILASALADGPEPTNAKASDAPCH